MCVRLVTRILLVGTLALLNALGRDSKPTLQSVGDQVYCLCGGCVAPLNHCPHHRFECSTRAEMEDLIQKEIAAGKDETAILQDFILRYGVKVLSTPPAKGFNLTVWILPSLGLIVGLVVVTAVARRWRKPPAEPLQATPVPIDPKVLAAVEEEIRKSGIRG